MYDFNVVLYNNKIISIEKGDSRTGKKIMGFSAIFT